MNYLAQGRSDEEKTGYVQSFEEILTTSEGQKPLEEDEERRRRAITLVLKEVNGLGGGSDKGASPRIIPSLHT